MTRTFYPDGVAISINLGFNDEPLLSLICQFSDDEEVEMVLTEGEAKACLDILTEGIHRAVVLREILTMFPEQRDNILANLFFRWTGEVGDGA